MNVDQYGVRTKLWSSPLIASVSQARKSAETMLRNSLMKTQVVPVVCAPDPRRELDDGIVIKGRDLGRKVGVILGVDLPLTAGDGAMRVDVGVI